MAISPVKQRMLYEINVRRWLKKIGPKATLTDIPVEIWADLAAKGITDVWLMGIWETVSECISQYCFEPGLEDEYTRTLPGWSKEDVIGSPYAIADYQINSNVGDGNSLADLREKMNGSGIRLILDFIPNHFHAQTELIHNNPHVFLEGNEEDTKSDSEIYFKRTTGAGERVFAHGKDPYFPAWQDTIQVDYSNPEARRFMMEKLLEVANLCDGVLCDMAMLVLRDVFNRTWTDRVDQRNWPDNEEFWPEAIERVKKLHPEFLFIAECYWDTEWELQRQGFDYTYDKKLVDRLKDGDVEAISAHLNAELSFQQKSMRFLENHDEERAMQVFGCYKGHAAALIAYTVPGLKFFQHGQWEGRMVKVPVQLGREPQEQFCSCGRQYLPALERYEEPVLCTCNFTFYSMLMKLLSEEPFQGTWIKMEIAAFDDQLISKTLLSWSWVKGTDQIIIFINYSSQAVQFKLEEGSEAGEKLAGRYTQIWSINAERSISLLNKQIYLRPYHYLLFRKDNGF